ncbi:MAG: Vms1/Ankzf1 family peptidyl-tRNA hydrolase [Dehalococcoidales bacterium]
MTNEESINEKHMHPEQIRRKLSLLASAEGDSNCWYSLPVNSEIGIQAPGGFYLPEAVQEQAQKSLTGFAVFCNKQNTQCEYTLVIPPFPLKETLIGSYIETAPLLEILEHPYVIGIVLIRLGSFAFGVSRGQNLVASKVGKGLVHGRHRQGGSSANRFARHREKQMEIFFTRACSYLREKLEPYLKEIDYILYGGARTTIMEFKKQCPFTGVLGYPELPSQLDLPDPNQAVLNNALERAWSSRVFTWLSLE